MKPIRTLIAPVVIAALAVTGVTAAQARADNQDVAKIIIGAIAVTAIASALDNSSSKAATVTTTRHDRFVGRAYDSQRYERERHHRRFALNRSCMMTYRWHHGARELYDHRCLERDNRLIGRLPRQCAVRVVVRGGRNRFGYDPRCLVRHGYREFGRRPAWGSYYRHDYRPRYGDEAYNDRRYGHITYNGN